MNSPKRTDSKAKELQRLASLSPRKSQGEAKPRKLMTLRAGELYRREGLMKALGVGQRGLQQLIGQGLPHVTLIGRQYFPGRLIVEWFESKVK